MSNNQVAVSFGRKLNWLKGMFLVTDGEIGAAVHESASLVCRWRSGQRSIDRVRGADTLARLAEFFAKCAASRFGSINYTLGQVLGVSEEDVASVSAAYKTAFVEFLYADSAPPRAGSAGANAENAANGGFLADNSEGSLEPQTCFIDLDGLLAALELLGRRNQGAPAGITVYLSLEHSRIFRGESAAKVWEALLRISDGAPVRVVFDNWTDADEAMKTLRGLLPFMQRGWLQLQMVKSPQKFFYNNISFCADGKGIVITTEPAGGLGMSVSMLVESPDYINGMGGVFGKLDRSSSPVEKHLSMESTREEAVFFSRLFEQDGDIKAAIDGVSLLYMSSDAYMRLLKLNKVTGSRRAYRLERFISDKRQFELFLEKGRMQEILNLPALDRMLAERELKTPDFSFFSGAIKADNDILMSLLNGMLDYLERYGNLSVYLSGRRAALTDFSLRIKADSFMLLYSYQDYVPHVVWSDAWLLVYEYLRQFDEALGDGNLITTRDAVVSALKLRLKDLGGEIKMDNVEALARAIHEDYCIKEAGRGRSDAPNVKPWAHLSEDTRESNRSQARSIAEKLNMIGFAYDSGEAPFPSVEEFDETTTALLSQNEHIRWVNERISAGWRFGPVRDDTEKIHPSLVFWDELSEEERRKDVNAAKNIIPLLNSIGLRVYRAI